MIRPNDFARLWADTGDEVLGAVRAVGETGWYVLGAEVRQLEAAVAELWGRRFCVGTGSGLDALEIALRALGCGPGDRVLTTPVSAFATTLAVLRLQAVPVFTDVDERGQIDLAQCRALGERGDRAPFLVPVHLYGQPLDTAALVELRDRLGCRIVEDCAQSILARWGAGPTGAAGQVAATSFYPTKNLGALGDGGAVLTDDPALGEIARSLRDYGQADRYRHVRLGYNSRLDEIHAAILRRVFLPRLEAWTRRRRAVARRYRDGLANPLVRVPPVPATAEPSAHLFPVLVPAEARDAFRAFLEERGVATDVHYPVAIPDQPAMRDVPWEAPFGLARARELCASEVSLPVHAYLRDDEVDRVVEAVNAWKA